MGANGPPSITLVAQPVATPMLGSSSISGAGTYPNRRLDGICIYCTLEFGDIAIVVVFRKEASG